MAGTFPTAGFTALDLQSNSISRVSESVSGKTQRIKLGAQFWTFKLKSPPLNRTDFNALYSFIVQQDGQYESFVVVPPVISSTTGTMSGTVTCSENTNATTGPAAGSKKIAIADDGSTATGTLKKGDLIKFSNHDKVYMVTEDFELNGDSSLAELQFYPPLTTAITSSTTIQYNSVPFTVFFDRDDQKYTLQADGFYRYELSVREDV